MPKRDDDVIINEGCPDWMMTMGDAMSLLLCFFVLLLTFSTPNESKLMDVFGSIQGALSLMPPSNFSKQEYHYKQDDEKAKKGKVQKGIKDEIGLEESEVSPVSLNSMTVVNRYREFKDRLLRIGFKNFVSAQQLDQGIVIKVEADTIFHVNTSKMKEESYPFLENYANLISSLGNEVRITVYFHVYSLAERRRRGVKDPWYLSLKRLKILGNHFSGNRTLKTTGRYHIPRYRFSYACKVMTEPGPNYIEFLIYEKIPVSQVGMAELVRESNFEQEKSE